MNTFSHVPPGFRFHPTDEELVDYYLRRKVNARRIDLDVIKDVDLYKIEPWDLQELCRLGTEEQNEWYFFSHKDKKYPTGTRTNRATVAGFWKATGRDKAIYSKHDLIGMRKTLVFYTGRAPNGQKSDWIMHEYRLETDENGTAQEEGWVVCRVFKKRVAATMRRSEHGSPCWYDDQMSFMPDLDSPTDHHNAHNHHHYQQSNNMIHNNSMMINYHHRGDGTYPLKKELVGGLPFQIPQENLLHMPPFMMPSSSNTRSGSGGTSNALVPHYGGSTGGGTSIHHNQYLNSAGGSNNVQLSSSSSSSQQQVLKHVHDHGQTSNSGSISHAVVDTTDNHPNLLLHSVYSGGHNNNNNEPQSGQDHHNLQENAAVLDMVATDWRAMDKFVASQLSQDHDISRMNQTNNYSGSKSAEIAVSDIDHGNDVDKKQDLIPDKAAAAGPTTNITAASSEAYLWK